MWKGENSHLPLVAQTVRIVSALGQTALPILCPESTQSTLDSVEKTLREDFRDESFCHDDVAWWNVGVYCDGRQTKAVMFEMQKVYYVLCRESRRLRNICGCVSFSEIG